MEKSKILVVEDEAIIAKDIQVRLQSMGYDVPFIVATGEEAINKVEEFSPDLVLMDIMLSDKMDGIEAAGLIRSRADIPIIYLTACSDKAILERVKITEPLGYLVKPVRDRELQATIMMGLHKHGIDKKIRESKKWFSTMLSSIGDAVIATDTMGRVIFMNPVAENLAGWKLEEAKGKAFEEVFNILNEKTGKEIGNPVKKAITERTIIGLEKYSVLITRAGAQIPIDDSSAPIIDTNGRITGVVLILQDITRRIKAEEELIRHSENLAALVNEKKEELTSAIQFLREEITDRKRAQAEALRAKQLASLGKLAAGVAHEINNPVNGIINYAQMLLNKSRQGSQEQDISRRIIKEGDRIAGIVKSLLLFARDNKEEKHPVSIHQVLSVALSLVEVQMKKDKIKLKVNIPQDLPEIIARPQQIKQVFLNIIINAQYALNQKYPGIHENKKLDIAGAKVTIDNDPYIRITFYDTGCGIPVDMKDKIMDPFFTGKTGNYGTGPGLSISHGIVSDHDGKIVIDSIEGELTKVIIDLPVLIIR